MKEGASTATQFNTKEEALAAFKDGKIPEGTQFSFPSDKGGTRVLRAEKGKGVDVGNFATDRTPTRQTAWGNTPPSRPLKQDRRASASPSKGRSLNYNNVSRVACSPGDLEKQMAGMKNGERIIRASSQPGFATIITKDPSRSGGNTFVRVPISQVSGTLGNAQCKFY